MIASGLLGIAIFVSYPVAPPRLAGMGLVDTVTVHSNSYRVLQPPAFVNQYAALPSLHVGWDLLMGIALATAAARPLLRALAALMPLAMVAAVVLTANHYLLDVVAGAAVALVGLAIAVAVERRGDRRVGQQPSDQQASDQPSIHPRGGPRSARPRALRHTVIELPRPRAARAEETRTEERPARAREPRAGVDEAADAPLPGVGADETRTAARTCG
jgi:membrane-associated phospholipid phosphatase